MDDAAAVLQQLASPGERELTVLFLDASDEALLRRFSSTRRPHPLATSFEAGSEQGALAVLDGIRIERDLLTVDGTLRMPSQVYRKVMPRKDAELEAELEGMGE